MPVSSPATAAQFLGPPVLQEHHLVCPLGCTARPLRLTGKRSGVTPPGLQQRRKRRQKQSPQAMQPSF